MISGSLVFFGINHNEKNACNLFCYFFPVTSTVCGSVTVSTTSTITPPPVWSCSIGTVSRLNYGSSEDMSGIIAPTEAASVTLNFTSFETELNYDKLTILSCTTLDCSQTSVLLDAYSGSVLPSPVTSNTGIMKLIWHSDSSNSRNGWGATWNVAGFVSLWDTCLEIVAYFFLACCCSWIPFGCPVDTICL